jgi:hypothetical protein
MSRPRGAQRAALSGFVSDGGQFTMRDLASSLKCSIQQANRLLFRAKEAGEVREVDTRRVEGVKRPVAVFQSAAVCTDDRSLAEAIQAWGR